MHLKDGLKSLLSTGAGSQCGSRVRESNLIAGTVVGITGPTVIDLGPKKRGLECRCSYFVGQRLSIFSRIKAA